MATSIWHRLGHWHGRLTPVGKTLILAAVGACLVVLFTSRQPPTANAGSSASGTRAPQPTYDPVAKWGHSKVEAARKVMDMVQQDCSISEEGSHLVVEMKMYIEDQNQRLQYVRAIADTDVILHGDPRNIYFYDPSGKQIAQADTLHGVRLVE